MGSTFFFLRRKWCPLGTITICKTQFNYITYDIISIWTYIVWNSIKNILVKMIKWLVVLYIYIYLERSK